MRKLLKFFLIATFLFSIGFLFESVNIVGAQEQIPLNRKQAVEIAERFVAANGYTKIPLRKSANIYLEEGEDASNLKKILTSRFDSIESEAVFAVIKEEGKQAFWSVQFLFRGFNIDNLSLAREIKVSLDGSKVSMNPKPIDNPIVFGDCLGGNDKKSLSPY